MWAHLDMRPERIRALARRRDECALQIIGAAYLEGDDLRAESLGCRRFSLAQAERRAGIIRIPKQSDPGELGHRVLQKLEHMPGRFATELAGRAGHVPAGPGQT